MRRLAALATLYVGLCAILATCSTFLVPGCDTMRTERTVGVVLGGASVGRDRLAEDSTRRIDTAIALYQRGVITRIMMTGSGGGPDQPSVAALMRDRAEAAGIPLALLSVEEASRSTLENALNSRVGLPHGESRVIVTSGYHALRGAASFLWAGRPGAFCAAPTPPERPMKAHLYVFVYETAAWGYNFPRALVWLGASALGVQASLPEGFLE